MTLTLYYWCAAVPPNNKFGSIMFIMKMKIYVIPTGLLIYRI